MSLTRSHTAPVWRKVVAVMFGGVLMVGLTGCGILGGTTPASEVAASTPSPELLPPPRPISSPEAGAPSASPLATVASPTPAAPPTRVPPPDLNAKPQANKPEAGGPRARVANTEGQGANLRAEPSPSGPLLRTVREGTALEVIGSEHEAAGRKWRNVRDPGDGTSGWIVSELLTMIETAAPSAAPAASEPKPTGEPKPAAQAQPAASPSPANAPAGAARPTQRIGEADRAYLGVLQEPVDALGRSITQANEQIERAGGRPDIAADATWSADTQAVARALKDSAVRIRAAKPGPATAGVHRHATNAADRADDAADGLNAALQSGDTRGLVAVRTTLVRVLAEINNMNLSLLDLQ